VALIVIAASLISKRYAVEEEHKALAAPV
jgi:hypothetical protein